jgi:hypothetical protein
MPHRQLMATYTRESSSHSSLQSCQRINANADFSKTTLRVTVKPNHDLVAGVLQPSSNLVALKMTRTCPPISVWDNLKGAVCMRNPTNHPPNTYTHIHTHTHTLEEFKTNFKATIANNTVTTLRKVLANMVKTVRGCIHEHGA